jgi:hypothetical protein
MKTGLRKRYESISVMLNGFNFARIQEYYALLLTLKDFEISNDEFSAWVRFMRTEKVKANPKHGLSDGASYSCPDCGGKLNLNAVNSMSCNQVGGDYKSMFSCVDQVGCGYSRYSDDTVDQWLSTLKLFSKPAAMEKMLTESKGCGGCGSK